MNRFVGIKSVQAAEIVAIKDSLIRGHSTMTLKGGKQVEVETPWLTHKEAVVGGYLVQYPDGYKSFSPKDVFEEAYRPETETYFLDQDGVPTVQADTGEATFRVKPTTDGRICIAMGTTPNGEDVDEHGENITDYFQTAFSDPDVCSTLSDVFDLASQELAKMTRAPDPEEVKH